MRTVLILITLIAVLIPATVQAGDDWTCTTEVVLPAGPDGVTVYFPPGIVTGYRFVIRTDTGQECDAKATHYGQEALKQIGLVADFCHLPEWPFEETLDPLPEWNGQPWDLIIQFRPRCIPINISGLDAKAFDDHVLHLPIMVY